jgi:hypothetical protein
MRKRAFICSSLRNHELRDENEKIATITDEVGFDFYLPQRALPYGTIKDSKLIFETNCREIDGSQFMIVNTNGLLYSEETIKGNPLSRNIKEGMGVEFEWGYGAGKGKSIVVYSATLDAPFPRNFTTHMLEELKQRLLKIAEKGF